MKPAVAIASLLSAILALAAASETPALLEHVQPTPILAMPEVKRGLAKQHLGRLEKQGEGITIMVVGESGSGKTSLLRNLFQTQNLDWGEGPGSRTTSIKEQTISFLMADNAHAARNGKADGAVPFTARLVDSPGWGDTLSLRRSFGTVTRFIDSQFEAALKAERQVDRPMPQERDSLAGPVDVVLYVFSPHRCKEIDLQFLQLLSKRVNVIPILAKADTMTSSELAGYKHEITQQLESAGIEVAHPPLAVICADVTQGDGTVVERRYPEDALDRRGRRYPWGLALAEHESTHSQLAKLRRLLLTEGLLELRQASAIRYEEYRRRALRTGALRRVRKVMQNLLLLYPIAAAFMNPSQRSAVHTRALSLLPPVPRLTVRWRRLGASKEPTEQEKKPRWSSRV